ncbi:MAG: energy transducer TonB [Planctomycetota bacterium]
MRSSAFFALSCAMHGVALTAALGYSAYAGAKIAAAPPLVQVQMSEPSAPSMPREVLPPDVVVEAVVAAEVVDHREVDDPLRELPPPAAEHVPFAVAPPPSLQRIAKRPSVAPTPPTPAAPPEPAPQEPESASAPASAPHAWVEAVECADNEPPRYPESERLAGHEGTVVVTATIDALGAVLDVALRQPTRYAALNREALRAVRTWRFAPARSHGAAVPTTRSIAVEFRLVDGR